MDIRSNELKDRALDWAVALAAKLDAYVEDGIVYLKGQPFDDLPTVPWAPTVNWSQAGPIIEKERISVYLYLEHWAATHWKMGDQGFGGTPLEAAMRAFVKAHIGQIVVVPLELL